MEHQSHSNALAVRYGLVAVLLWSTVATAFKLSLEHLSPSNLLLYASVVSALFLMSIVVYEKKLSHLKKYFQTHFFSICLYALLNPFLYYLVLFKAYELLPAQQAQPINFTWALMIAYLSIPILGHKLSRSDVLAGLVCYGGVYVIVSQGNIFGFEIDSLEGLVYALASTLIWALYWLFHSKKSVDAKVALLGNFLLSIPLIVTYIYLFESFQIPSLWGFLGACYVGLFEMGLTFIVWLKAMQLTHNASQVANLIFISPFLSFVFISYFVGEQILLSTVLGFIFIIIGLLIQNKKLIN